MSDVKCRPSGTDWNSFDELMAKGYIRLTVFGKQMLEADLRYFENLLEIDSPDPRFCVRVSGSDRNAGSFDAPPDPPETVAWEADGNASIKLPDDVPLF